MIEEIYIYEIIDLNSSREFLKNFKEKIILTNPPGSVKYYGILVLHYMFESLKKEFSNIIEIQYNLENDFIATDTAVRNNII